MKCSRVSCRAPMELVGYGEYRCSEPSCGSTTVLSDPAVGYGLSASSKPSTAEERSYKVRAAHDRAQATRRRIIVLGAAGYTSAQIAAAMSAGVRGGVLAAPVSVEAVEAIVQGRVA